MTIETPPDIEDLPPNPSRMTSDEDQFVITMDNWLAAQPTYRLQIMAMGEYVHDTAVTVASLTDSAQQSAAQSANQVSLAAQQVQLASEQVQLAANEVDNAQAVYENVASTAGFVGLWIHQSGIMSPPVSVYHAGQYWHLLKQINVASVEPGTDATTWLPMVETEIDIGQIAYSFSDLTQTGLFIEPGMTYLQSAYPELFDIIGIGRGIPTEPLPFPAQTAPSGGSGIKFCTTTDDSHLVIVDAAGNISAYKRDGLTFGEVAIDPIGISLYRVSICALSESAIAVGCVGIDHGLIIYQYDSARNRFVKVFTGGAFDSYDVSYSDVSGQLAVGTTSSSGHIKIFDIDPYSAQPTLVDTTISPTPLDSAVRVVCWHPDGKSIYSSDWNPRYPDPYSNLTIYALNGAQFTRMQIPNQEVATLSRSLNSMRFNATGSRLAVASNGKGGDGTGHFAIIGIEGGVHTELFRTSLGGGSYVSAVEMSKDGKFSAVSTNGSGFPTQIYIQSQSSYVEETVLGIESSFMWLSEDERFLFAANSQSFAVFEPAYPFDINTEFYVPDVASLTPEAVGTWVPDVAGKPYVRAK